MIKLEREQLIAVGALAALLLVLFVTTITCLQVRSEAAQGSAEQNETLSQLEARAKSADATRAHNLAPAAAFVDASTLGLAGSQLQAHLSQLTEADHAVLISAGIQPAKREDPPNSIRLQATLDANLKSLQTLLYQLESGTPYVFVDSLAVQLLGQKSEHAEDPLLRMSLGLHAIWRRSGT
jgi:general secretion pathway protein M